MLPFFTLNDNLDTVFLGKIKIVYGPRFEDRFSRVCKKHRKFEDDFHGPFMSKVVPNSIMIDGSIMSAKTVVIPDVGCDDCIKVHKARKFWSTDLRCHDKVRIDYIYLKDEKILFLIDLRMKNIKDEENHDQKYIRDCVEMIKDKKYTIDGKATS